MFPDLINVFIKYKISVLNKNINVCIQLSINLLFHRLVPAVYNDHTMERKILQVHSWLNPKPHYQS